MHKEHKRLNLRAGSAAVSVAFILFLSKSVVSLQTGSMAVLASALDSAFDFLSSGANLLAIYTSHKPADHNHRFGHGKTEAIAGFVQSQLIFITGCYIVYRAWDKFQNPSPFRDDIPAVSVMLLSLLLTGVLVTYQRRIVKKTGSVAVSADHLHYWSDLSTNAAIIISLLGARYLGWQWLDPLAGAVVAIVILKGSLEILKTSTNILMDRDISEKYRKDLIDIIESLKPDVIGYHDLRARTSGHTDFLHFHLEMPQNTRLKESNKIIEKLTKEMKEKHPNTECIVHADPVLVDSKGRYMNMLDYQRPRFY